LINPEKTDITRESPMKKQVPSGVMLALVHTLKTIQYLSVIEKKM